MTKRIKPAPKPKKPREPKVLDLKEHLNLIEAKAIPYNYPIELLRVLDGDTIEARIDLGFKIRMDDFIRLYDIDTPETKGKYAEARGEDARLFTAKWFADGKVFRCDSRKYNAREKYGRILGAIYRDTDPVSLNDALREAGHVKLVKKITARVYDLEAERAKRKAPKRRRAA